PRRPSGTEEFLHPVHEGGRERTRVLGRGLAELLEQLPLPRGELGGHLHHHLVHGVAASAKMRHALAAQAELLAGLGARRHAELRPAAEHGHFHLVAEGGLGEGEWQLAEEVGALSHEDLVRLDVKDHVEVTRGSSEAAAFSLAAEAELIAVFHAGRDGDLEQPLPSNARLAAAVLARRAVDLTLAAA